MVGTFNTLTEKIIYEGTINNVIFEGNKLGFPMDSSFTTDLNMEFAQNM
jgi:hypothetical protein